MNYNSNKFNLIIPPQDITCEIGCLDRFANGDRQVFAWLYMNYSKKAFDYFLLITRDEKASEDLVQEAFVKLWMNRQKLSTVENFNGYFYRLQKNLAINTLKQKQMELNVREQYFHDNLRTSAYSFELLEDKEKKHSLEKCIKKLPQKQQVVFRLCKEDGWKRQKIAEALKVSPFTVKCHLQKAVSNLRLQVMAREG